MEAGRRGSETGWWRGALVAPLALVVLLVAAATAGADGSLQLTVPSVAVRDVPTHFSASGVPPSSPSPGSDSYFLMVGARLASLGPCAAEESDDPISEGYAGFDGPTTIDPETQSPEPPSLAPGVPFSIPWDSTLDSPEQLGAYLACGWIEGTSGAVARASVPFQVRAPVMTLSAITPRRARVGRRDTFVVRGSSESPALVDAELLPPYAYSCDATDSHCVRRAIRGCTAKPGVDPVPNPSDQDYYDVLSHKVGVGAHFDYRLRLLARQPGRWRLCAWVQEHGIEGDGVLVGPKSSMVTVQPRGRRRH